MVTNKFRTWILIISVALNVIFVAGWLLYIFDSPTYRLGELKENVRVGYFTGDTTLYMIPKGITVADASEQGLGAIGQFENNRFEIIITTDRNIVDYNAPKARLQQFGNYYSGDRIPGIAR